jgi:uncharacterized protein
MTRTFSPERLDLRAFAEDGAQLAGELPLSRLARLASEAREGAPDPAVTWSAAGELRNPGHVQPQVWLRLQGATGLTMTCQRCLEAMEVPLAFDRAFRFVADEQTAAAEDEEAEEDVLAISRAFDLFGLLEDELLMEVPLVPRHERCPAEVPLSVQDPDFEEAGKPENPFARLAQLRRGEPS